MEKKKHPAMIFYAATTKILLVVDWGVNSSELVESSVPSPGDGELLPLMASCVSYWWWWWLSCLQTRTGTCAWCMT